jgi:thiol-disulfide isomerase/thioredoxin
MTIVSFVRLSIAVVLLSACSSPVLQERAEARPIAVREELAERFARIQSTYASPGEHRYESFIGEMLDFLEQSKDFESLLPPGSGEETIGDAYTLLAGGHIPDMLSGVSSERRSEVTAGVSGRYERQLRRKDINADLRSAIHHGSIRIALLVEGMRQTPDVGRVRTMINAYQAAYPVTFLTEERDLYRFIEWEERYCSLLRRIDPVAVSQHLQVLTSSPHGPVAEWAKDLLGADRLYSTPLQMSFTAVDGREVDLEKLRGKVVLINFTGITWCGACREEEPLVKAAYERYHSRGFEIVSITQESSPGKLESVLKHIQKKEMGWPHYFDGKGTENPFTLKYGIQGYPTHWLLDKEGRVISTRARGPKLEPLVREYLALDRTIEGV